jgi:hypothetical protein
VSEGKHTIKCELESYEHGLGSIRAVSPPELAYLRSLRDIILGHIGTSDIVVSVRFQCRTVKHTYGRPWMA